MKHKLLTALLAVLLLAPCLTTHAEEAAFALDETRILQGMGRSWQQGYTPAISNNRLTLVLPVLSEQASGTICTELLPADEVTSPFKPQTMSVRTARAENGIYAVRLQLELYADRQNGDYPCTLRITGQTSSGETLRTDLPYTLRIRDGLPNEEALRLQLSDVVTDLRVGEDGAVTLILKNPCHTVTAEQPELRISDATQDILPQGADVLYLDSLQPGESQEITYPLTVRPTATVSSHILQISLNWRALGQTVSQTESHTVPVTQEMRLKHGGVQMASSVVAGDSLTISLPLMNMGRASLTNVLATLSLPGLVEKQSVLVGTIAPGETRQAQLTLTPGRHITGEFFGALQVEAEDADGNATSLSLPIELSVEAPAAAAVPETIGTQETLDMTLVWALTAGCALLLMICLVQGCVLRRRIHHLEEDRL